MEAEGTDLNSGDGIGSDNAHNATTDTRSRALSMSFPKLATKTTLKDVNGGRDQESGSATATTALTSPARLHRHDRDKNPSPTSASDGSADPVSPSKMRTWFRTRLARPRAKSSGAASEDRPSVLSIYPTHKNSRSASGDGDARTSQDSTVGGSKGSFVGGAALTKTYHHAVWDQHRPVDGAEDGSVNDEDTRSAMSSSAGRPSATSMREVALAGRRPQHLDGQSSDVDGGVGTARAGGDGWKVLNDALSSFGPEWIAKRHEGGNITAHDWANGEYTLSALMEDSSGERSRFLDARSSGEGGGAGGTPSGRPLTSPPKAAVQKGPRIATPVGPMVGMTLGKVGSPVRESKFSEILD